MVEDVKSQELERGLRELACAILVGADEYLAIGGPDCAAASPEQFEALRPRALALSVVLGQLQLSAVELLPQLHQAPAELRAPASALVCLGALSASCALISHAEHPDKLADVQLLRSSVLEQMLCAPSAAAWFAATAPAPSTPSDPAGEPSERV
jgi:hypothetical protein